MLAGVDSLVLRAKTRSSSVVVWDFYSVCPSELIAVEQFLHLLIRNWFLTVSWLQDAGNVVLFSEVFRKRSDALFYLGEKGVRDNRKRFVERRKRSMAATRWILLKTFCKLTVCHLSSSQTCETSSEKHSVFLLTFLRSVSNLMPPGLGSQSVTSR